jgi:hypothetical protein
MFLFFDESLRDGFFNVGFTRHIPMPRPLGRYAVQTRSPAGLSHPRARYFCKPHPWGLPFGPAFGRPNSLPASLSLLGQRQICLEQIWSHEVRPKGSRQDGRETAVSKRKAARLPLKSCASRFQLGSPEGASMPLWRRAESIPRPFGLFQPKAAVLGAANGI